MQNFFEVTAEWNRREGWPRQVATVLALAGVLGLVAAAATGARAGWFALADLAIGLAAFLAWVRRTLRIEKKRLIQGWGLENPFRPGQVWTVREMHIKLPKVQAVWVEPRAWHYKAWSEMYGVAVGVDGLTRVVVDDEYAECGQAQERARWLADRLGVQFKETTPAAKLC